MDIHSPLKARLLHLFWGLFIIISFSLPFNICFKSIKPLKLHISLLCLLFFSSIKHILFLYQCFSYPPTLSISASIRLCLPAVPFRAALTCESHWHLLMREHTHRHTYTHCDTWPNVTAPVPPPAQFPSYFLCQKTFGSLVQNSAFVIFELQGRVSFNREELRVHTLCKNPLCFHPNFLHEPNREFWS